MRRLAGLFACAGLAFAAAPASADGCGDGGVSFAISFGSGWSSCGPGWGYGGWYNRPYYRPYYSSLCGPSWSYSRSWYDDCRPRWSSCAVAPVRVRPVTVCEVPARGHTRATVVTRRTVRSAPQVVASAEPAPVLPASSALAGIEIPGRTKSIRVPGRAEPLEIPQRSVPVVAEARPAAADPLAEAWAKLTEGKPGAMGAFASLVAVDPKNESARLGYAIAAAGVGQFDRAEWAAAGVKGEAGALAALAGAGEVRAAAKVALRRCRAEAAKPMNAATLRLLAAAAGEKAGPVNAETPAGVVTVSR